MRPSFQEIYMGLAKALSKRSTCERLNVGCVVTTIDFTRVLGVGYNGGAKGQHNGCDRNEPGNCGCVLPGTLVNATNIKRAYRRRYSGEVVRITTAMGNFSITPNHPVLTNNRGWVPAKLLNKGDDLIGTLGGQGVQATTPNNYSGVPIEEIFESLSVSVGVVRCSGAGHDFHGDGIVNEDVDIITVDGSLSSDAKGFADNTSEPRLSGAFVVPAVLGGFSQAAVTVKTDGFEESCIEKSSSDNNAADSVMGSQGVSGLTGFISGVDLSKWELNHVGDLVGAEVFGYLAKNPGFSKPVLDSGVRNPTVMSDIHDFLSGHVTLNKIVDVEIYSWSGHVYNLQTKSNWYSVLHENIVVHNCLHAEDNALLKVAEGPEVPKILFCTHLPCSYCSKRIINKGGITTVYFNDVYRSLDGLAILNRAGIQTINMGKEIHNENTVG